jgi:hypothetical protein
LPPGSTLPRLAAADWLFLFAVKKKQKTPAENFSFEASGVAGSVESEKFVRPDLSRTKIWWYGLVGWKCLNNKSVISKQLTNNINGSAVEGSSLLHPSA